MKHERLFDLDMGAGINGTTNSVKRLGPSFGRQICRANNHPIGLLFPRIVS